ncbi:hypothetical protein E2327_16830 [Salmonella enterica subsp. enterica]|nr:hypothetical protein [Salmonella enterica subsp. enterica]ECF3546098.1 hypothetical protein [Salmonella enterica subsp. enterica]ECJ5182155.1 hypothetical protein [Salmonella enterica subsp. enterica]MKA12547.1 hypothetical protein [Salmonella enterica subsp. enterica]
MTTNNHPAHGPVSLDRLHQIRETLSKAAAQSDGGNLGYAMADAVKVIDGAIAAFGAEPAGYADPQAFVNFKSMGGKNAACTKEWMWRDPYNGLIPLYTAPPATIVPDEIDYSDLDTTSKDREVIEAIAECKGWNAAMLQGKAEPVSTVYKLDGGENCWSCGKYFTYEQHSECDGYCPHCDSPVDLDDEEDKPSKVVPNNPTEEMVSNAWREAIGKCDHETIKRIYATMLAAAPQQEVNGIDLANGKDASVEVVIENGKVISHG